MSTLGWLVDGTRIYEIISLNIFLFPPYYKRLTNTVDSDGTVHNLFNQPLETLTTPDIIV